MNNVNIHLVGGLGNQLFQVATVYSYSRSNNCDYSVLIGDSSLKIHSPVGYFNTILREIPTTNNIYPSRYNQPNFSYTAIPTFNGDTTMFGYFQSEKYFKNYRSELLELFDFPKDVTSRVDGFISGLPTDKPLTAIHVRRGDYLKFPNIHMLCGLDYYERSMAHIGDSLYVVVSDDLEWCKTNIRGENIIYSPFTNEVDDLYLISRCDNKIIANSSFSWWGAWLSKKSGTVISPSEWFGHEGPKDYQDVVPSSWLTV